MDACADAIDHAGHDDATDPAAETQPESPPPIGAKHSRDRAKVIPL